MKITKIHFILYVKDQTLSAEFYSHVLNCEPSLNVPGMTEFALSENSVYACSETASPTQPVRVGFHGW